MSRPSARLRIEPAGLVLPVAAGQSLLQAANAAGVRLPASCRNGSCRACMCRLLQGQVRYRIEWPGLLAEEKQDGWILPCVAEPLPGDAAVELVIEVPMARLPD